MPCSSTSMLMSASVRVTATTRSTPSASCPPRSRCRAACSCARGLLAPRACSASPMRAMARAPCRIVQPSVEGFEDRRPPEAVHVAVAHQQVGSQELVERGEHVPFVAVAAERDARGERRGLARDAQRLGDAASGRAESGDPLRERLREAGGQRLLREVHRQHPHPVRVADHAALDQVVRQGHAVLHAPLGHALRPACQLGQIGHVAEDPAIELDDRGLAQRLRARAPSRACETWRRHRSARDPPAVRRVAATTMRRSSADSESAAITPLDASSQCCRSSTAITRGRRRPTASMKPTSAACARAQRSSGSIAGASASGRAGCRGCCRELGHDRAQVRQERSRQRHARSRAAPRRAERTAAGSSRSAARRARADACSTTAPSSLASSTSSSSRRVRPMPGAAFDAQRAAAPAQRAQQLLADQQRVARALDQRRPVEVGARARALPAAAAARRARQPIDHLGRVRRTRARIDAEQGQHQLVERAAGTRAPSADGGRGALRQQSRS